MRVGRRGRLAAVVVLLTACGAPAQSSTPSASLQASSPTTPAVPSSPTANTEASRLVGDIVVSPDTPPPGTEFNGTGDGQTALFDTDEHAEAAFDLFHLELVSDDGYALAGSPATLGDEGVCGEGPVPTPLGEETICIWRNGTLLLAAGGALAGDGIHATAQAMDARAP